MDAVGSGVQQALETFFRARAQGLTAVYLFGSVARGSARADSDVDVAVLYSKAPPLSLEGLPLDLEDELERLLGRPVQVVPLNRAPVDLVHRVLRDGKLILDANPAGRIEFEVRARNEYFDLLPVLERYRRLEGGRS
jgi:predicted nucleotidyltransferase